MALVRAASWHNSVGRFGVHLPLYLLHDMGLLLTAPRGVGLEIGPRAALLDALNLPPDGRNLCKQYQGLLETIAGSEVVQKAASWHLRDELVAVLLTKI